MCDPTEHRANMRAQLKLGTRLFFAYATLLVLRKGQTYTVGLMPVEAKQTLHASGNSLTQSQLWSEHASFCNTRAYCFRVGLEAFRFPRVRCATLGCVIGPFQGPQKRWLAGGLERDRRKKSNREAAERTENKRLSFAGFSSQFPLLSPVRVSYFLPFPSC
jgi:hypothetical protein